MDSTQKLVNQAALAAEEVKSSWDKAMVATTSVAVRALELEAALKASGGGGDVFGLELMVPSSYGVDWGDTIGVKDPGPYALSDALLVCGGRAGLITYDQPSARQIALQRVQTVQGDAATQWGFQLNGVTGEMVDCGAHGLGRIIPGARLGDGHGAYLHLAGSFDIQGFIGTELAGQGTQLVARPWENPKCPDGPITVRISGSQYHNCSYGPKRGSFMSANYCAAPGGTTMIVEHSTFSSFYGTADPDRLTRGALNTWSEPYDRDPEVYGDFFFSELYVGGCSFYMVAGDRSPIQTEHTKVIRLVGNQGTIIGAHAVPPLIDIKNPEMVERIEVDDNGLDGSIWMGGKVWDFTVGDFVDFASAGLTNLRGQTLELDL